MSDGFNTQIIKIPTRVRVFHLLSYVLPVAFYSFVLILIGEFTVSEIARILVNPVVLISMIVVDVLLPTLIYNYFIKLITKYDGTPESVAKVNKEIKVFDLLHVALVLLNILITTTVVISVCSYMGLKPDPMSIISSGTGCVFLFGFFPFVFWMQYFEEALAPIPFARAEIPITFVTRNVCLILFSLLGILFFTVAPIFVLANEDLDAIVLFMTRMLPCGGIALAVSITNMVVMQVSVQNRIDPLTKFAYNLSKRDYTQDNLKIVSRDEIGFLTENMNEFITTTRSLLVAMADSIDVSKKSASILSDKMTETSSAVTEINANIENVKTRVINQSAGVEQADATIKSMVQKMNGLAGSVERQSSDISNSSSAVEQMVANIRSVSDILVKNSASVNNLTAASDTGRVKVEQSVEQARTILEESAGLLEASDIIQNIAEQTNLLAMNAAIEAAHAGEAGKGFAVVSDEIRKLAEQSNTQGKTISAQLEKLQQSISNITTATKEVQDQFGIIFNLAETVKNQETIVERAMQEQSAGSAQVLDSIKSMKQSTAIIQSGSGELENGTKEVSAEMKVLSEVTEEINGAMVEISNGTLTILSAVNDVNENSEANFANLNNLTDEISKFAIRKR